MKVYPNPTENILNVESFENVETSISYQLFDATGKVVRSENLIWHAGTNKVSLDLKNYAAGSYYLIIRKPNANGILENFSYKIQKTN
ncbi:MAG: T9SS type A sorting domain-containing protein [Bacteroidetes bacterium]|nr:T9SS type A sorting domain-containing protein [Bacteroidota bacterium]